VASKPFKPFSSKDAVVCRNVSKTWAEGTKRAHVALRDVDLDVTPGEFIVLLGPSGCGKSTLLYLIAGLEQESGGEIWSFGDRVATPSPDRSLIFQETSLFPWLTVGQNASFGLSIRGDDADTRKATARDVLQRVGLTEAMDKRPDELSGGMRQRVAVARALAMRPKVLLMDEPFAALDVQTRAKMQDFLLDVWRDSGASVLFVTHHIDEAVALVFVEHAIENQHFFGAIEDESPGMKRLVGMFYRRQFALRVGNDPSGKIALIPGDGTAAVLLIGRDGH